MKTKRAILQTVVVCLSLTRPLFSFCGFYVAKADAKLFNKASQVVLVHNEGKTAITMVNDFKGDLKEFAIVVPVPSVLSKDQIYVGEKAMVERIDAFSAPRLVEYFDPDPCQPHWPASRSAIPMGKASGMGAGGGPKSDSALGVKIEAKYTVGEYDILILSAEQSTGLEKWLVREGYKIPKNASKALDAYIKQDMKFFVAKVNLKEQSKTGFTTLRPIQMAFESPKFMLPIRLGMVNAEHSQDLLVYAITKKGRVEATNYRTVKFPTGTEIPVYVKEKFSDFYRAAFDRTHDKEGKNILITEYAWNMSWCDPCATEPLTPEELRKLGVFWLPESGQPVTGSPVSRRKGIVPPRSGPPSAIGSPVEAFVTRIHVRYDREHFPEDLVFQETSDTENYQARFVLRHEWSGESKCEQAKHYTEHLPEQRAAQAENLASLTGWDINEIRKEMSAKGPVGTPPKWYKKIFK